MAMRKITGPSVVPRFLAPMGGYYNGHP